MLQKDSYQNEALEYYHLGQDKEIYLKPEISETSFSLRLPVHLTYNELVTRHILSALDSFAPIS